MDGIHARLILPNTQTKKRKYAYYTKLGGVCRRSEVKFIVAVHCFLAKLKEESTRIEADRRTWIVQHITAGQRSKKSGQTIEQDIAPDR